MVVQQPYEKYTTFHFQTKGQPDARDWVFTHPSDDTMALKFGPTAPFWETYIG